MGPRKVTPKGFRRISSTLSRRLVARSRERRFACALRCSRHWGQNRHRARGERGDLRTFDRKKSRRGETLPPGKHKSPGCRTLEDRLLNTTHGSEERLQCRLKRNRTEEVTGERNTSSGNPLLPRLFSWSVAETCSMRTLGFLRRSLTAF